VPEVTASRVETNGSTLRIARSIPATRRANSAALSNSSCYFLQAVDCIVKVINVIESPYDLLSQRK
jgi:hypothetical protein